jgi:hypothetical protein
MKTMEEYKSSGGFVARVPGDITHIITRPKNVSHDGGVTVHSGPETLSTEIVEENGKPVRVVRFSSILDFRHLRSSINGNGLGWEDLNPELCRRVCELCRPNQQQGAGPIRA